MLLECYKNPTHLFIRWVRSMWLICFVKFSKIFIPAKILGDVPKPRCISTKTTWNLRFFKYLLFPKWKCANKSFSEHVCLVGKFWEINICLKPGVTCHMKILRNKVSTGRKYTSSYASSCSVSSKSHSRFLIVTNGPKFGTREHNFYFFYFRKNQKKAISFIVMWTTWYL